MPVPSTEQKPRRRLVPDLSDTIEVGGEKLVRAQRAPVEDPASPPAASDGPLASIDDVARKHVGPDVSRTARVIEENADFIRALGDQEDEIPSPRDLAGRIEIFSEAVAVVPPAETDPLKRDGVTTTTIVGTEDAPDELRGLSEIQTIFDLFARVPMLDGVNYWIHVERKQPKLFGGTNCAGVMRKITAPISLAEWDAIYGGGTYKLIAYGPPRRGTVMNGNGQYPFRAITEPFTMVFPGPPNLFGMVHDEDEDMTQGMQMPLRRGPHTAADASVENKRMDIDAGREQRIEQQSQRDREKAERAQLEKQAAESSLMQMFLTAQGEHQKQMLALQNQAIERERQIAEERKSNDEKWEERVQVLLGEKKPDDVERVIKLAGAIGKNDGSVDALRDQHKSEMERLARNAKDDAERAEGRVREASERADRRIKEEQERAENRIREVEARFANVERDARERSDREIARVTDECNRRVQDMQHQHQNLITQEDKNHQRDIASLTSQHQLVMEAQKSGYEMRLDAAKNETKRASSDADRARADAESKGDLGAQLDKLRSSAAAIGLVDASEAAAEPPTLAQSLLQMGVNVAQGLPGIVESIAGMAKGRAASPQDIEAQRAGARQHMIDQAGAPPAPPRLPPPHARRRDPLDGYMPRHMTEVAGPRPRAAGQDPYVVPPQPGQPYVPVQTSPPPPQTVLAPEFGMADNSPPPPLQPGAIVTTGMPVEMPPIQHAPQAPPPPSMPPPSELSDQQALAEDQQILQMDQLLRPQYANDVPLELLAQSVVQNFGVESVRQVLRTFTQERFELAIRRSGDPSSPFLRRDGKKYVMGLMRELAKQIK